VPFAFLRRAAVALVALIVLSGGVAAVHAQQLPSAQLFAVSPPGGRQASTVELKLAAGADLDGADRLYFSHPGIVARLLEGTSDRFTVTIDADVPPGLYDVRAIGRFGISNPRTFAVDGLPEVNEEPGHDEFGKAQPVPLGSVINGICHAAAEDYFRFEAKKGQRVILDAWAERLDSRLDATLVLYDADERELARNRDFHGRDAFIDALIPADGHYVVALYDFLYQGGVEYFYRLAIHAGPYLDFAMPSAAAADQTAEIELFGRNLPGGEPVPGVRVHDRSLERLRLPIRFPSLIPDDPPSVRGFLSSSQAGLDAFEYRLASGPLVSNACLMGLATAPVVAEHEPNDDSAHSQLVVLPCEIAGQFYPQHDHDWFQFEARKGETWWIEIVSQRLGLATDPSLLLERLTHGQAEAVDVVEIDEDARNAGGPAFNTAHGDAAYRFQVPVDGTYRLLVRDLSESQADARHVYRLALRAPQPDFRLVAVAAFPTTAKQARPWCPLVRRGGTAALEIVALRRDGFDGPIEVAAAGLPEGLHAPATVIGPGQDRAALIFNAADDAAAWAGAVRVMGRAQIGDRELVHSARSGTTTWPSEMKPDRAAEARLTQSIVLSVSGTETMPVRIELGEGKAWAASRSATLEIPIKIIRRPEYQEPLTLLPVDLPEGIKAANVTVLAKTAEAKLSLEIGPKVRPGPYGLHLVASTKIAYRRGLSEPAKDINNVVIPSTSVRVNVQ
jgi:hypothetical protein